MKVLLRNCRQFLEVCGKVFSLGRYAKMSKKQRNFAELLRSEGLTFEEEVSEFPGTPDIFFREKKLIVFFHGCYWHNHGCGKEIANTLTLSQRAGQAVRDVNQQKQLLEMGFRYLIVWECEYDADPHAQVDKVKGRLHFN